MADKGHSFVKKSFSKTASCHECSEKFASSFTFTTGHYPGFICEVCNFIAHDKCVVYVISPCPGIAACIVKNPVAHCWSEPIHYKKKCCCVCRQRIVDLAIQCMICDYFVHLVCHDFAVPDCRENATYIPGKEVTSVKHAHHWREGNLPQGSKCAGNPCVHDTNKKCWSTDCLTGYRCECCGITSHGGCRNNISDECTFGVLQPIYLSPNAVSIPRTDVPMESIIGVEGKSKTTPIPRDPSCHDDFSSSDATHFREEDNTTKPDGSSTASSSHSKSEREEERIKVFDGNCSLRSRLYRNIVVSRYCTLEQLIIAALRSYHIRRDPNSFYLTDLLVSSSEEVMLQDPQPVITLNRVPNKLPAIFLRFRDKEMDSGIVRVYARKIQLDVEKEYVDVPVNNDTSVADLIRVALSKFDLDDVNVDDYRCSEVLLDRGVAERILCLNEKPWDIMKQLAKDSVRQMELMRFYLQHKQDPHGPNIALFIGNLPQGLSQRNYEQIITNYITEEYKFSSIGPIYYEYGSVVITFEDASKAVRSFYNLREIVVEDKKLQVLLLPNIEPSMISGGVQPLLVFVNVKSGGCQGLQLISSFRKLLNPYQVFDLDNGGPLPGLYVFRHIKDYKILVCGGDGTIGWVLQCLDNVGQDSECSSPPCAIVPLGTGNDLARVLRWGTGYTGGEDPLNLLRDVIDAEEIRLDRWTVVFHPEDKQEEVAQKAPTNTGKKKKVHLTSSQLNQQPVPSTSNQAQVTGATQSEDNSQMLVMNNYFGIGIDADLCLDFHTARVNNPDKFNSRLHNKSVYVKMGLRKMVSGKLVKDLNKKLRMEVDGKNVELPAVEGIIILNILSWGSGANPWGAEREERFNCPNHWDGMLEVVGVSGVVHLGQIQSGFRSATRIAQGGHIKILMLSDIPVQVDGEPWLQPKGDVVVFNSALKATMLKKNKCKIKRRNTEPTMSLALVPKEDDENDSNNTDF